MRRVSCKPRPAHGGQKGARVSQRAPRRAPGGAGRGAAGAGAPAPPPPARLRSGRCLSLLEPPLRLLLEPGLACSLLGLELRDLTLDRVVEALALGQPALGPRPL